VFVECPAAAAVGRGWVRLQLSGVAVKAMVMVRLQYLVVMMAMVQAPVRVTG
jgi:hypothetical protein